ncbi:hypothetical protein KFK09_017647 [Dendrobium nobile]|uniref:Uncharacterized protein n=1 Tax=Dendrobium nobile TaxID=94219 RepID=A0A8T3B2X8_DENNO|nr:hypothetical protein KFK09_017647 [Dendrobium nobile]
MSNGYCDVAVGTREPPSDVYGDFPIAQIANNVRKPQNGTHIKSIVQMLTETRELGRSKHGVKKAVRQKRWKG